MNNVASDGREDTTRYGLATCVLVGYVSKTVIDFVNS